MPLSSSRTARTVHEATCVKVNCERTHLVPQFARSNLRSRTGAALSGRSSPVEQLFAAPVRLTGKVSIAVSVCRTHCGTLKSAPYSCCDTCTSPNAAPPRLPLSLCSFVVKSLDLVPSSLLRILEVECLGFISAATCSSFILSSSELPRDLAMSLKITTGMGQPVPPAPRHSVTVHMGDWAAAECFADGLATESAQLKNGYPRLRPHNDIVQVRDLKVPFLNLA